MTNDPVMELLRRHPHWIDHADRWRTELKSKAPLALVPRGILRGASFPPSRELFHHPKLGRWFVSLCSQGPPPEHPQDMAESVIGVAEGIVPFEDDSFRMDRVPLLLFHASIAGLVLTAVVMFLAGFVLPTFEQLFDEFQLTLPASTRLILNIRTEAVWFVATVTIGFIIATGWIGLSGQATWFPGWLPGSGWGAERTAATWISDLALLLQHTGDAALSLEMAGHWSTHPRIEAQSRFWAQWLRREPLPETALSQLERYPTPLLDWAWHLPDTARVPALRQVAWIELQRRQKYRQGWDQCFSMALSIVLACLIIFVVLALFMPLVALVTGLS